MINIRPEIMEVVGFSEHTKECVHGVSAAITKHPAKATGGRRGLFCHSLRTHIRQGEM